MAIPIVTPMVLEDVDLLMPIEHRSFHEPWSRQMYLMDLKTNRMATYLVVRPHPDDMGRYPPLLAYGGLWLMVDEAHVATVASHPEYRGCGLGHHLMLSLLDAAIARGAIRSTLEVRVGNGIARRLYEQLGYRPVGTRRHYYQDGEDALLMTTPDFSGQAMVRLLDEQRLIAQARLAACFAPSDSAVSN